MREKCSEGATRGPSAARVLLKGQVQRGCYKRAKCSEGATKGPSAERVLQEGQVQRGCY